MHKKINYLYAIYLLHMSAIYVTIVTVKETEQPSRAENGKAKNRKQEEFIMSKKYEAMSNEYGTITFEGMDNIEVLVSKIKTAMDNSDYCYYGLRKDDYQYKIGDICHKSHQLWQDPEYDWDTDELIYPYIEKGTYAGFYDGGELDGTCAIVVYLDNIEEAIQAMNIYSADHLYLIAGDYASSGNDQYEIVIENATVLDILY